MCSQPTASFGRVTAQFFAEVPCKIGFFGVLEVQSDFGVIEVGVLHQAQRLVHPDPTQKPGVRLAKRTAAMLLQGAAANP